MGGVQILLRLTVLFLGLWVGVVVVSNDVWAQKASLKPERYGKVLKRWTREQERYQRTDFFASTRLVATWLHQDFIESVDARLAQIYQGPSSNALDYGRDILSRSRQSATFFVSFYAYDYKNADLSDPKNQWQVYVEQGGQRYNVKRIDRVKKLTPFEKSLFDYCNQWSQHFYLSFDELPMAGAPVRLVIAGPLGQTLAEWVY